MSPGESSQELAYHKSAPDAFGDAQKALSMIGEMKKSDPVALSIEGTSKYGLQNVRLIVRVTPQGNESSILIRGFSDDIWASGAKNCISRLQEAMGNLDNPEYRPSKTGVSPQRMILTLLVFVIAVLGVIVILPYLPLWVTGLLVVFGVGALIWSLVAGNRFSKQ